MLHATWSIPEALLWKQYKVVLYPVWAKRVTEVNNILYISIIYYRDEYGVNNDFRFHIQTPYAYLQCIFVVNNVHRCT